MAKKQDSEIQITHKVIKVGGRSLTVWKKTFEMSIQRFTLMEQAQASMNGNSSPVEGEGIAEMIRRGFRINTYPSLAACTTGKVFTHDECLKTIEHDDLELWLSTARDLNSDWFPSAQPETNEEITEKKES